jgi:hypothetical protein
LDHPPAQPGTGAVGRDGGERSRPGRGRRAALRLGGQLDRWETLADADGTKRRAGSGGPAPARRNRGARRHGLLRQPHYATAPCEVPRTLVRGQRPLVPLRSLSPCGNPSEPSQRFKRRSACAAARRSPEGDSAKKSAYRGPVTGHIDLQMLRQNGTTTARGVVEVQPPRQGYGWSCPGEPAKVPSPRGLRPPTEGRPRLDSPRSIVRGRPSQTLRLQGHGEVSASAGILSG